MQSTRSKPKLRRSDMRRSHALRLLVTSATMALAATMGVTAISATAANGATGSASGFASQNGGTTGGSGGQTVRATTGTEIHAALCNRASRSTPITIEVEGTINHANTSHVRGASCTTAEGVIELKQISNVTIVGVGSGAVFDQIGIHIREASNIIIQNATVRNVKKSGSPISNGGDAISMEAGVRNVWADHLTLEASGGESEGYDGLFDMKNDTKYVTLSYSIMRNSERGGLIGSSETDNTNSFVTFHHNLYQNLNSRTPLLRGGIAHMYNNHYVGLVESGINSRAGGEAKVENNYFKDSKDVLGTFYTNLAGYWQVADNIFDNVRWGTRSSDYNPAGPDPTSTTSVSIPYAYTLDWASCVPALVSQTAGANNGLQVSDGSCTPTSPPTQPTQPTEPTTPPTEPTTPPAEPTGANLSLGAGVDGSSKATGTSYANVVDGDLATYWSPAGSTGRISVKWATPTTVSSINIREAADAVGNIGSWRVVNHDNGAVLATGTGAGVINFTETSLSKINFEITSSSGTPRIAEFETYAGVKQAPAVESVSVTPATATVVQGAAQQFTAEVAALGGADAAVTWSVQGAASTGTTVSSDGLLTVGGDESATSVTVVATSVFDSSKTGSAAVTVERAATQPGTIATNVTAKAQATAASGASIPVKVVVTAQKKAEATSQAPSGQVTVRIDGRDFVGTLDSGKVTVSVLTAGVPLGMHVVEVTYSGDATYAAGSTSSKLTISKAKGGPRQVRE